MTQVVGGVRLIWVIWRCVLGLGCRPTSTDTPNPSAQSYEGSTSMTNLALGLSLLQLLSSSMVDALLPYSGFLKALTQGNGSEGSSRKGKKKKLGVSSSASIGSSYIPWEGIVSEDDSVLPARDAECITKMYNSFENMIIKLENMIAVRLLYG